MEKSRVEDEHKIDYSKPSYSRQSRSLDGEKTWMIEEIPELGKISRDRITVFSGKLDFLDAETAIRFVLKGLEAGAISPFFYSKDRCKTWIGPFETPSMGLSGISARTEILPLSKSEALLFFACPKADGREECAAVAKISEGGRRFEFLSYIGEEPPGFTIMPSAIRRQNGEIIVLLREDDRYDNPNRGARFPQFISADEGKTWVFDQYVDEYTRSTPPSMKFSTDGRLYLTYGFRDSPQGVAIKYSDNEGRTWSKRYMLRDDGGNYDLGYTRITALPNG